MKARKEIKDELDIKKDYKDYKFMVTFLVQDKKGRWSVPCKFLLFHYCCSSYHGI